MSSIHAKKRKNIVRHRDKTGSANIGGSCHVHAVTVHLVHQYTRCDMILLTTIGSMQRASLFIDLEK